MFLLKSAWDNILFHLKRSILSVLLIAIASGAILLYRGFVEYSEQGLAMGFIASSGHIQINLKGAKDPHHTEEAVLHRQDMDRLRHIYRDIPAIKTADAVLHFQGIIGTDRHSAVFWGAAFDSPEALGSTKGTPVFAGEQNLVLGKGLFESLAVDTEREAIVNLMSSVGQSGLLTGSFEVSGMLDTGTPQNDAGLVIASRSALLDFFELEDSASYMRVFLKKDSDMPVAQAALDSYFAEHRQPYETYNWKELNPSWEQISGLFNNQFFVISAILYLLIFVALTQSLSASFMERIGEFGTMEAIGLKRSSVMAMLLSEACLLSLAGIAGGILLSQLGNVLTETFDIKMTPPGYSKAYRLSFFITARTVLRTQFFIFLTGMISVLYPMYTICRHSTVQLIHYSDS